MIILCTSLHGALQLLFLKVNLANQYKNAGKGYVGFSQPQYKRFCNPLLPA